MRFRLGLHAPSWLTNTVVLGALSIGAAASFFAGCSSGSTSLQCKSVVPSMTCSSGAELQICAEVASNDCHFEIGYQEYPCSSCSDVYDCQVSAYMACSGGSSGGSGGSSGSSSGGTDACSQLLTCCASLASGSQNQQDCEIAGTSGDEVGCTNALGSYGCPGAGSSSGSSSGGSSTFACGYNWPTTTCATCMNASCCSYAQTCFGDPVCASLYQCALACSDQACINSCGQSAGANATQEYNNVVTCAASQCNNC